MSGRSPSKKLDCTHFVRNLEINKPYSISPSITDDAPALIWIGAVKLQANYGGFIVEKVLSRDIASLFPHSSSTHYICRAFLLPCAC